MNIELKNVKVIKELSEETVCFTASLYVDGVKKGQVSNRGFGGDNDYDLSQSEFDKINTWCKKNLKPYTFDGQEYPTDLDLHVYNLVDKYEDTKWMKSQFKKYIIVIDDTMKTGEYKRYNLKPFKADPEFDAEKVYKGIESMGCFKGTRPCILNRLEPAEAFNVLMHGW